MRNLIEPYRPASCISIIVLDWMVYVGTMAMHRPWDTAWLISTSAGSLATLFVVGLFESRASGVPRRSFVRAIIAALAVAVPLPLLGSVLGGACLLWLAFSKRTTQHAT